MARPTNPSCERRAIWGAQRPGAVGRNEGALQDNKQWINGEGVGWPVYAAKVSCDGVRRMGAGRSPINQSQPYARRGIEVPPWVQSVAPLREPVFGTSLPSLRLHLLMHTPAPFRRRNLFIDSSVGDPV